MSDVRTAEDRTAMLFLEHFDGIPDKLWTDPGAYGGSRRKPFRPDCVHATWRRRNDEPWKLAWLSVTGKYLRANTSTSIGVNYLDCGQPRRPVEDWLSGLIATFAPAPIAQEISA